MKSNTIRNPYSLKKNILRMHYKMKLKILLNREMKVNIKNKICSIVIKISYKQQTKQYRGFKESLCKKESCIQNK